MVWVFCAVPLYIKCKQQHPDRSLAEGTGKSLSHFLTRVGSNLQAFSKGNRQEKRQIYVQNRWSLKLEDRSCAFLLAEKTGKLQTAKSFLLLCDGNEKESISQVWGSVDSWLGLKDSQ